MGIDVYSYYTITIALRERCLPFSCHCVRSKSQINAYFYRKHTNNMVSKSCITSYTRYGKAVLVQVQKPNEHIPQKINGQHGRPVLSNNITSAVSTTSYTRHCKDVLVSLIWIRERKALTEDIKHRSTRTAPICPRSQFHLLEVARFASS